MFESFLNNKKGFIGTSVAGIVSVFLIFFILLIFIFASLIIAGKANIPFSGEKNNLDKYQDFEKNKELEIKRSLISIVNHPLDDGSTIKGELIIILNKENYSPVRDFNFATLDEWGGIADIYTDRDFCFKTFFELEEPDPYGEYFRKGPFFYKFKGNYQRLESSSKECDHYSKSSIYILSGDKRIKIELYVENE